MEKKEIINKQDVDMLNALVEAVKSVIGGLVYINATLYSLCEVIPEYLDLKDN